MTGRRDVGQTEQQETIDLQDFLKMSGVVETGGEAKFRVQGGEVRLNGEIETRRRKKLRRGDIVQYAGQQLTVDW
ncbi:RNA-binding S4 domain-containing protein [Deinococcus frigens]|uniref:RNA-binding S4 domain-containing protein n=1 Tax=Deinococcus frigens TaxID=249403 RepID=UPI00049737B0|nr:RNA-binding S4 domain-containing protein [Deinococcus frigens]